MNCAPFNHCVIKISNSLEDNPKDVDVVIPPRNLKNMVIIIQKHREVMETLQK